MKHGRSGTLLFAADADPVLNGIGLSVEEMHDTLAGRLAILSVRLPTFSSGAEFHAMAWLRDRAVDPSAAHGGRFLVVDSLIPLDMVTALVIGEI